MENKEHVAADDEDNDVEMEEETSGLVAGKSQERGGKGARKSNSSNVSVFILHLDSFDLMNISH